MKTIGSHPGAISFRFGVMLILILIFIIYFFYYFDDSRKEIERASILQTKRIIDSSLAVVFATYAVNGKLSELNELDGANPFVFLRQYDVLPAAFQGEIDADDAAGLEPGWHYLVPRKLVVYVPRYLEDIEYYRIGLNYRDLNQSGRFEAEFDKFQNLHFTKKPRQ